MKLHCGKDLDVHRKKTPIVLLVVECGSGIDNESSKTMKQLILKFISDLKENEADKIFLVWNEKSYELTQRPLSETKEILEVQHPPTDKIEMSYQATLDTVRHNIVNLKDKITEDSHLSIVFFSSQIEPAKLLI
jgi:hypothetical protein